MQDRILKIRSLASLGLFVGNDQGRDWNFQSRLNIHSRLKLSIQDWNFQPYGLKTYLTRSLEIDFFQSLGPLGWKKNILLETSISLDISKLDIRNFPTK